MNIVIPLAGKGTRFKKAGFTEPKVLINVLGKPMFYWSLKSLNQLTSQNQVTFVCLDEHLNNTKLKENIYQYCPNANIVAINEYTRGQAETVLETEDFIKKNQPLLVFNGDTYQELPYINHILNSNSTKGKIFVFTSSNPSYSYVDINKNNEVTDIKEKKVISKYATTGLYYFPSTERYISATKEIINSRNSTEGEYYISNVIQRMLEKGEHFEIIKVEKCYTLGTPMELESFKRRKRDGEGLLCLDLKYSLD
ncbi:glycosyltransferase family 2 protein [Bacillus sp. SM2101]|uniref:glycosyltransferase family 2 protein n=1 Tax=Bacillus sp. SM2101 TaxID=2805366 RepID=UPI001BDE7CA4|nr:glycosyltransferase family 2 protein [Bacillus sp. SM2101]